jgi:hypothetical protein
MADVATSAGTGFRFRFSLLTTFLVMAIVGLSLALYSSWAREDRMANRLAESNVLLDLAERDVERLRRQFAQKSDADRSLLQAAALRYPMHSPTERPLIWSWYVSIPDGHHYDVHIATGDDLGRTLVLAAPPGRSTAVPYSLSPGKHEIVLISFRHSGHGKWVVRLGRGDGSQAWEGFPKVPWGDHRVFTGHSDRNGNPSKPFVIGRCEVHANATRIDGAIIWLEPSAQK